MAEERLKTLRMRRTLTPALPDDRPDDDRNPEPAPVHVSRLRRQIDHLVRRQKHEIIACMNDHRTLPHERRADGHARERLLGDRHVEDTGRPESFEGGPRRAEDALVVVDADPEHEYVGILLHALDEGFG